MVKNLANKFTLIISIFVLFFILFAGIYVEIVIERHLNNAKQDTTIIISDKDTIKPLE